MELKDLKKIINDEVRKLLIRESLGDGREIFSEQVKDVQYYGFTGKNPDDYVDTASAYIVWEVAFGAKEYGIYSMNLSVKDLVVYREVYDAATDEVLPQQSIQYVKGFQAIGDYQVIIEKSTDKEQLVVSSIEIREDLKEIVVQFNSF